jgi:DNA-3-methyladenine glycosylase II
MRRRGGSLVRLLHLGDEPVVVHARAAAGAVRLAATAPSRDAAFHGIERLRFALGLDLDLRPFQRRFRRDPLLGPAIRARPWLRPPRRPDPFETLAFAIAEQLIESEHAEDIQRLLTRRYGRQAMPLDDPQAAPLRDFPAAATLARRSPPELEACGLSARRALALRKAAHEVAAGRADLTQHEPAWRRLRAIPTIGPWTIEKLAWEGQGRLDQLPAGDLAYRKLVGRLEGIGRRADEDEVRSFFERFEPFQGVAGLYLLSARRVLLRDAPPPWVALPPPGVTRAI